MNEETLVMDPVDDVIKENDSVIPAVEPEEVMEIPANINPKLLDELTVVNAEQHDIAEEIGLMDTFKEYQREIFAEMRGFNSDQF